MFVEVELFQVIITEGSQTQVIVLREKNGERFFPIFIGFQEALAIDRKLKELVLARPLTHDLLHNIIQKLNGKLLRIVINDMRNDTYFALLEIGLNKKVIQVDSRPSDAIALAARASAPIFVEEQLLNRALTTN